MSAPRVIYLLSPYPFPVDFGNGAWSYGKNTPTDIAYILKSDYDELKVKLTESERLNKVALEAMKMDAGAWVKSIEAKRNAINNAIREIEGALK